MQIGFAAAPFPRASRKERTIVGGEKDQRVVVHAQLFKLGHQPADIGVEIGDHRAIEQVDPISRDLSYFEMLGSGAGSNGVWGA